MGTVNHFHKRTHTHGATMKFALFSSFSTILPFLMTLTQSKAFDWAHQNNVLGEPLQIASTDPMTGFTRDGKCTAYTFDSGSHTVAAVMTNDFLEYTKSMGNDLSTPRSWGFPGLIEGNRWCLCVSRWMQAMKAGHPPPVLLEATNESVLAHVDLDVWKQYKWDGVPALTGSREPVNNDDESRVAETGVSDKQIDSSDDTLLNNSNLPLLSVIFVIVVAGLALILIRVRKESLEESTKEKTSFVQP